VRIFSLVLILFPSLSFAAPAFHCETTGHGDYAGHEFRIDGTLADAGTLARASVTFVNHYVPDSRPQVSEIAGRHAYAEPENELVPAGDSMIFDVEASPLRWGGTELYLPRGLVGQAMGSTPFSATFETVLVEWNIDGHKSSGPVYPLSCRLGNSTR
jgi:hypothetical protein